MNKYFKILLYGLIPVLLFGSGFYTSYLIIKKDKEIIKIDRFSGQTPAHATGYGNSMLPTLTDGQRYEIFDIEPQEGDVIVFTCSKLECSNNEQRTDTMAKRLIKIREDGAWWVLGDNREVSHDSNDFGWILPSERSNVWVVKL